MQRFYQNIECRDSPYEMYEYPIQKECLRWSNGTQTFEVDAADVNITQTDYAGNDNCGKVVEAGKKAPVGRKYIMQNMRCYELYGNRGFSWTVTSVPGMVSSARSRRPGTALSTSTWAVSLSSLLLLLIGGLL